MNENDFATTKMLLEHAGFHVCETRCGPAFGSWYVCAHTDPRLGIVWDGKDGLLYVRRESGGPAPG